MSGAQIHKSRPGSGRALNVDLPHAGRIYPVDFQATCSLEEVQLTEDRFADLFYEPVLKAAYQGVKTDYPRSYVDVNREEGSSDVIRYQNLKNEELQTIVSEQVRDSRLARAYFPYFAALDEITRGGLLKWPRLVHLNLHSFPTTDWHWPGRFRMPFEIEVGTLGDSSPGSIGSILVDEFKKEGFNVGYNEVFSGGHILKRFERARISRLHAVQIEVRRDLYLQNDIYIDSEKMEKNQNRLFRSIIRAIDSFLSSVEQ